MNGITPTSKMKEMPSLSVIESNRNLQWLQEKLLFHLESHVLSFILPLYLDAQKKSTIVQ
jgi:hypothetical protein